MPKVKTEYLQIGEISGTPDQVASQIYHRIIGPMVDAMDKEDPEQARLFAMHIFGLSTSMLADTLPTESFERFVTTTRDTVVGILKKERGELKN